MQNRAYSILAIKAMDEEQRTFAGVATTPSVDRVGDIIEPLGVSFKNPLPLLWQHEHDKPIGTVRFDTPTDEGINFEASIASTDEPGTLKDRLDEAWQSIRMGLVRAVSIGFRALEHAMMEGGGIHFLKTEIYELSAVTIPANSEALITSIKSIDAKHIPVSNSPPAASGKMVRVVKLGDAGRARPLPIVHVKRT